MTKPTEKRWFGMDPLEVIVLACMLGLVLLTLFGHQ